MIRLAICGAAVVAGIWLGSGTAAASPRQAAAPLGAAAPLEDTAPVEEPGCIPGASGFVVRLCLATPPPLGPTRAGDVPVPVRTLPPDALFLETLGTTPALLKVESRVRPADRVALVDAVARDVPAVEAEYGRVFASRPVVRVFATVASFEYAVTVLFRYSASQARSIGVAGGLLDRGSLTIAINWQRVSHERPVTIVRHELSHLMLRQILGPNAEVPAWFDEGLATLAQRTLGASGEAARQDDDYLASAILGSRTLSLAQLVTTESWLRASAAVGGGSYSVAGAAAETLREAAGRDAAVRILEIARTRSFEEAFADVTRRSLEEFARTLDESAARRAPPAIVVAATADAQGNLTFTLRGFPPGERAEITIEGTTTEGAPYRLVYTVEIDALGAARGAFGSTAPPGTYAVRARTERATAAAILRTAGRR